jgi:hypothetical protein
MSKIYYKYRDFINPERTISILKDKELYASLYKNLNDPMEGVYRLTDSDNNSNKIDAIYSEKNKLNICSLSAKNYDKLMWSHYSDGCRGIVIGVKVNRMSTKVIYDGRHKFTVTNDIKLDTKKILSHKNDVWNYEEEYRFFTRNSKIEVEIVEVFLGMNISKENREKVLKICANIDGLKIYEQQKDYSFIPEYSY